LQRHGRSKGKEKTPLGTKGGTITLKSGQREEKG